MERLSVIASAALILLGFLAYLNSFSGAFVLDDIQHIVESPNIRTLTPFWAHVKGSTRPLVDISFALNYASGGLNPFGYHLVNLVIHILGALVLFGLVRRTLQALRVGSLPVLPSTGFGFAVALLWMLHPLQTESVTYIIQRSEALMGLFYLLTLYSLVRGAGGTRPGAWFSAAVVSCALGMMSKPVMASAPLIALIYDRVFLSSSWKMLWRERKWFYAGLALTWVILGWILATSGQEYGLSAGPGWKGLEPLAYAKVQTHVIFHYLWLAFWPSPLILSYHWPVAKSLGFYLPTIIFVSCLVAGTVWALCYRPALGFLGAWFFLILMPTSSFIPLADPVFEHRMYLPLAVVVALAVGGGWKLIRSVGPQGVRGFMAVSLVSALAFALGTLTFLRNRDYQSHEAIWRDTLSKQPFNPRAHANLGAELLKLEKLEEAARHLSRAIELEPGFVEAYVNLGSIRDREGRVEEAVTLYAQALEIEPSDYRAHYNWGNLLARSGRLAEAKLHYERALAVEPRFAQAHNNLGNIFLKLGADQEAIFHYREAVRIDPGFALGEQNLKRALAARRGEGGGS
ncbi:MAG: tetratricopeptide repeat protein [Candidatus Omnitrophica bacterium]|nr:tetratricopeptide repeat protein [Candidatus Omnitrophota bacterium]